VADSRIGGTSNVEMNINFKTGHYVPSNGLIEVRFPSAFNLNLIKIGATCSVTDLDIRHSCIISGRDRIQINLNGNILSSIKIYTITIKKITLPNFDSTGLSLTISSYFSSNVLSNQVICSYPFPFPNI
jgi:hypothetical protein